MMAHSLPLCKVTLPEPCPFRSVADHGYCQKHARRLTAKSAQPGFLEKTVTERRRARLEAHAAIMREKAARKREPDGYRPFAVNRMIERAAYSRFVTVWMVLGPGKGSAAATEARREVSKQLRAAGCSLPLIARYLNIDHSAVLHLLRTEAKEIREAAAFPPSTIPKPIEKSMGA
jgi:hypothetical protein